MLLWCQTTWVSNAWMQWLEQSTFWKFFLELDCLLELYPVGGLGIPVLLILPWQLGFCHHWLSDRLALSLVSKHTTIGISTLAQGDSSCRNIRATVPVWSQLFTSLVLANSNSFFSAESSVLSFTSVLCFFDAVARNTNSSSEGCWLTWHTAFSWSLENSSSALQTTSWPSGLMTLLLSSSTLTRRSQNSSSLLVSGTGISWGCSSGVGMMVIVIMFRTIGIGVIVILILRIVIRLLIGLFGRNMTGRSLIIACLRNVLVFWWLMAVILYLDLEDWHPLSVHFGMLHSWFWTVFPWLGFGTLKELTWPLQRSQV